MKKPLIGTLLALTLAGAAAAPAMASAPRDEAPKAVAPTAVDFAGTVALSNCSGSLVRTPASLPTDPALVLSNGHCLESGMPGAGQVVKDQASSRTFSLLNSTATKVGTLQANRILYATMTDTDISVYRLTKTYQQIQTQYGIGALTLDTVRPAQGASIKVVSGYWKSTYSCNVDGFAYRLKEDAWTWKDSVRYTSSCNTIGGTSGSPVIDTTTGKVVAVNNTGNESGGTCTLNNPCEVDQNGAVTVRQGINYAQQTYIIVPCVGPGNVIDLNRAGCTLPKP
ncbi:MULTISPECIES: serine protease [unclassified Streptomyces]|uniref:S1 family peptidase n=1 Tax=unclassified Streptomyces TaxID=2593676 RepID=UPI0016602FC6|nr:MULTISPECIES: serine protease [unclassified Streptomyces]MBD0708757.1 hypothetical protein [Streptomyces sp. CBMA291]MBD0714616.1 hypothetical protein [Streptomyces sp. CBMA370]